MTKNLVNTPLILVGVTRTETRSGVLERLLEQGLHAAGAKITPSPARILADSADLRAAEFGFQIAAKNHLSVMCNTLADFPGDYAIVPAKNRKKRLLICDMDSTIISEECLDELADFAGLKAEISDITERAMAGELNFEEALTTRVNMLKGLPISAVEECYAERINLNTGARTLVATMKANGAHCLLVSGGFTAFTSRVAAAAGFHSHYANELLTANSVLTGAVKMPILGRASKLERLQAAANAKNLSTADAVAIGDGANDLAMISAAGLGIAFRAKPIVVAEADAAITHTDLTTALFYQGYSLDEFVEGQP